MNFEEYLQELADPSVRVRVAQLVRLSALASEQAAQFSAVWPTLAVRRRRQVMQELTDLAEDNVELNFDAVFFVALEDGDAQVRLGAVRELWEHDGPDLVPALLKMLDDQNAGVRAEVALALGRFVLLNEYGKLRERHFREVEAALRRRLEDAGEVEEVRG